LAVSAGLPALPQPRHVLTAGEAKKALKEVNEARKIVDQKRKELTHALDVLIKKSGPSAADTDLPQVRDRLYVARIELIGPGDSTPDAARLSGSLRKESKRLATALEVAESLLETSQFIDGRRTDNISESDLKGFKFEATFALPPARLSLGKTSPLLNVELHRDRPWSCYFPRRGGVAVITEYLGADRAGNHFFRESRPPPAGREQDDVRVVEVTHNGLHVLYPAGTPLPPLTKAPGAGLLWILNALSGAALLAMAFSKDKFSEEHPPPADRQGPAVGSVPMEILRGGKAGKIISDVEPVALVEPNKRLPLRQSAGRLDAHEKGLWHQVVHVYLVDRQGRILLQRRSLNLRTSPGKLQVSASGHVDAQDIESVENLQDPAWVFQVALREGEEELGIPLDRNKLIQISGINEIRREEPTNNEFATVLFYPVSDDELEQARLNYDTNEVEELVLLSLNRLPEAVQAAPGEFSGSIHHLLKNYPPLFNRLQAEATKHAQQFAGPGKEERSNVKGMIPKWKQWHAQAWAWGSAVGLFFENHIVPWIEEWQNASRRSFVRNVAEHDSQPHIGLRSDPSSWLSLSEFIKGHSVEAYRLQKGQIRGAWVKPTQEEIADLNRLRRASDGAYDEAFEGWWYLPGLRRLIAHWFAYREHSRRSQEVDQNGGVKGMSSGEKQDPKAEPAAAAPALLSVGSGLTWANAWRFPVQNRQAIRQLLFASVMLAMPPFVIGWLWNMGYRVIMGRRMLLGESPWPGDGTFQEYFHHGRVIGLATFFYIVLPVAMCLLIPSPIRWLAAGLWFSTSFLYIPSVLIPYSNDFNVGVVFKPWLGWSMVRLSSYWKAWVITGGALAVALSPLIPIAFAWTMHGSILTRVAIALPSAAAFFIANSWLYQVACYAFGSVYDEMRKNKIPSAAALGKGKGSIQKLLGIERRRNDLDSRVAEETAVLIQPASLNGPLIEGDQKVAFDSTEMAEKDMSAIREEHRRPFHERVMQVGTYLFDQELDHWLAMYPAASASALERLKAHWHLLRQMSRDIWGGIFTGPLGILPWLAFVIGVHWIGRHYVVPGSAENFDVMARAIELEESKGRSPIICLAGEQATSRKEAQQKVDQYLMLARKAGERWKNDPPLKRQVAIKFSAFDIDFKNHQDETFKMVLPIAQACQEAGLYLVIDGEFREDRAAQIELFHRLQDALPGWTGLGIMVQTYFQDSSTIIDELIQRARAGGRKSGIRIAKGAYYEREKKAAYLVWQSQEEVDRSYRKLTVKLLQNADAVYPMIASMNPREQAWAFNAAKYLNVNPDAWESEMLYGMQPELGNRLVARGQNLREYMLFGDVITALKYFARRRTEITGPGAISRLMFDFHVPAKKLAYIDPDEARYLKVFDGGWGSRRRSYGWFVEPLQPATIQPAASPPAGTVSSPPKTGRDAAESRPGVLKQVLLLIGFSLAAMVLVKILITAYDPDMGTLVALFLAGAITVLSSLAIQNLWQKVGRGLVHSFKRMGYMGWVPIVALFLVSGVWRYGKNPLLALHDLHHEGSKAVYYLFDMHKWKPIPGAGTAKMSKGFVHFHLQENQLVYDILKVPLASTPRYQIRMKVYRDIHGRDHTLQDYLDQTPGAMAAVVANYVSAYIYMVVPNSTVSPATFKDPAGLVVSQGQVRHPFDSALTSPNSGIGNGIIALNKNGQTQFLVAPTHTGEVMKLIDHFQEAAQLGPRLIWPDSTGKGQIVPELSTMNSNEWGFVAMDRQGNLFMGVDKTPLGGLVRPLSHRGVANQLMSWSKANGIELQYALATDGGGFLSFGTKGLFKPDLRINPPVDMVSLIMIVDTQAESSQQKSSSSNFLMRMLGWLAFPTLASFLHLSNHRSGEFLRAA